MTIVESQTHDDAPSIAGLFEAYQAAYDDYDAEALAACFVYPCTIWQFGKGNVFVDSDELLENIEALLDVLEGEEIVATRHEIMHLSICGDTAHATLAWRHMREDDEEAMGFTCHYMLLRHEAQTGGRWLVATIVNE